MGTMRTALAAVVVGGGLTWSLGAAPAPAAAPPRAKTFTVTAAPAASVWSQGVRLTAVITPRGGGVPQGGAVTFLADGEPVGTAVATTRGTTLTTTALEPGEHRITATYAGDGRTAPGASTDAATVTVAPAPTTVAVAPTEARVLVGRRAEIKATVRPAAPAAPTRRPTGRVTFTTSCRTVSVAVNANGVATWRAPLCPGPPGNRTVRATYTGSAHHAPSAQASTTVRSVFPTQDQQVAGDLGPDVPVERHGDVARAYAQTFTAGRSGLLTDVGVGVLWDRSGGAAPRTLQVTIRTVDEAGVPTGTVLGAGAVTPDGHLPEDSPTYLTLALDQAAPIVAGTRYALVFETAEQPADAFGRWHLWSAVGDVYADPLHHRDGPSGDWTAADHDLVFTTWVHTPA